MSPLQLAVAYSALLNGGRIWEPTLGWAVVDAQGKVVRTIDPKVRNRVPVQPSRRSTTSRTRSHFRTRLGGLGRVRLHGSPYKTQIGGKTGTAEVFGKQDTSWLATWGPIGQDSQGNPTRAVRRRRHGRAGRHGRERRRADGAHGVGRAARCRASGRTARIASGDLAARDGGRDDAAGPRSRRPARRSVRSRSAARRNGPRGCDLWLVGAALALALIGAVLVWSATRSRLAADGGNPQTLPVPPPGQRGDRRGAGGVRVPGRRPDAALPRPGHLWLSLLGLRAVFVVGTTVNGAHAWIELAGGLALQPSEYMKLGLIVGMAVHVRAARGGSPGTRSRRRTWMC